MSFRIIEYELYHRYFIIIMINKIKIDVGVLDDSNQLTKPPDNLLEEVRKFAAIQGEKTLVIAYHRNNQVSEIEYILTLGTIERLDDNSQYFCIHHQHEIVTSFFCCCRRKNPFVVEEAIEKQINKLLLPENFRPSIFRTRASQNESTPLIESSKSKKLYGSLVSDKVNNTSIQ